jgi:hypothetical protein
MVKITGSYQSFSILEFTKTQGAFLQDLMQREKKNFNKVFFEQHIYKKTGAKTLKELPKIQHVTGFKTDCLSTIEHKRHRKLCLKMPLKMLHEKYMPLNMFNNKTINSSIKSVTVNYRRKRECDYFLLKVNKTGVFNFAMPSEFDFLDLEIIHQNCFFKNIDNPIEQLLNFSVNSNVVDFKDAKNNLTTYSLIKL